MQGPVKLFLKVTVSLGDKKTENERVGNYYTEMVLLLLILFAADVKEWVLNFIVPVIEKWAKKICTMVYRYKTTTYNIRSNIWVLVTVRTYFWTDWNILFYRAILSGLGSIPCGTCLDHKNRHFKPYSKNQTFILLRMRICQYAPVTFWGKLGYYY